MPKPMTLQGLKKLEFKYAGTIQVNNDDGRLRFDLQNIFQKTGASSSDGWVYVWVKEDASKRFDVCYVGKAGRTLWARCNQHVGGFHGGSTTGISRKNMISEYLKGGVDRKITLYARKSPDQTILGEHNVSMCEVEERAMISKLRRRHADLWNASSAK